MQSIINYFINSNSTAFLVTLLLGMGLMKFFQLDIVKTFFHSIINRRQKKQEKKQQLSDSVQKNYFQFISKLSQQNNQFTGFLKEQVLKEVSRLNTVYDILQRYIIAIMQKNNETIKNTNVIIQRLSKPFLQKGIAKWLMQLIMQTHINKKIQYLRSIKTKYKSDVKKQKIIVDVYRVFKQITRQQVQIMDKFDCVYGSFGNPLRQILQTQEFDNFIRTKIFNILDLQQSKMIQQAQSIMLQYKQQMLNYLQNK